MEDKYYKPEAVKDLALEVFQAIEALKYLYSSNNEALTSDLIDAFKDLSGDCEEFSSAFNFYAKKG